MSKKEVLEIGSRVVTGTGVGKKGIVRYIGEPEFATGEWIGIELLDSEGKNDGSVAGVRYFTCPDKRGLFVKRLQVKLDKDAPLPPPEKRIKEIVSDTSSARPPSKLPSFDERKPSQEIVSTPEPIQQPVAPTVAAPAPVPVVPASVLPSVQESSTSIPTRPSQIPEIDENILSQLQTNLQEEKSKNARQQQQYEQEIKELKAQATSASLRFDEISRTQQHTLDNMAQRDQTIQSLEKRVGDLLGENKRLNENYEKVIQEKDLLKELLETEKEQSGDQRDQQQQSLKLMNELTSLQSQYTSLLQTYNTLLSTHQQTLDSLDSHSVSHKNELKTSSQQIKELESSFRHLQEVQAQKEKELEKCAQKIQEVERERDKEREEKKRGIEQMQSQNNSLMIKELENQIAELSDNLEMVTLDAEQRQIDLETAEERIQELEAIIQRKEEDKKSGEVSLSDPASTSLSSSELEDQNNRLKEALKRLQALHLTSEKTLQKTVEKYETELKTLREEKSVLECYQEKAEELSLQLDLQHEEMKDLAQQIDDTSGYADMVETLSTQNTELSTLVSKLKLAVSDYEAGQEIQEELDLSQRQEIDSLRKANDNLLIGIQTIETEKGELYRKISDSKLKNERMTQLIERLQGEVQSLKSQIEEEKNDLQLVSSRVLDERVLRRLLQEERNFSQSLLLDLSKSKRNQLIAEAQTTRLQLIIFPLLQHISRQGSSHSISFFPHDTQELFTHLLSLPSLRNSSGISYNSLTIPLLQNIMENLTEENNTNEERKTKETNLELLCYLVESLISSMLYTATGIVEFSRTSCLRYLNKHKENAEQEEMIPQSFSMHYLNYLMSLSQLVFPVIPFCWHLIAILAYLPDFDLTPSFYELIESNLWIFKDLDATLQTISLHSKEFIEKQSIEEIWNQLRDHEKKIQKFQEVLLNILPSGLKGSSLGEDSWRKILLGELNSEATGVITWHQNINATTLLMRLELLLMKFHLEFCTKNNTYREIDSSSESTCWFKVIDGISKHFDRITKDAFDLSLTFSKYSQLRTLFQSLQTTGTVDLSLCSIFEQIVLILQTVVQSPISDLPINTVVILHEIFNSMRSSSYPLSYSWMIDGVLPGFKTDSHTFCGWVKRGLRVGKNLVSIVELEDELNNLKEEKSTLLFKEETLRVEKRALLRRLEDNENMLEKYMNEKNISKDQEEKKMKEKEEDEVAILRKENKVLSEALEIMNGQLQELEEQVQNKQSSGHSPKKSAGLTSKPTIPSKKKDDAGSSSGKSVTENIFGSSTTPSVSLPVSKSAPTQHHGKSSSSPETHHSDTSFSSSHSLHILLMSLRRESNKWRRLATSRLVQSLNLRPLPVPSMGCAKLSHRFLTSPDQGVEERKEEVSTQPDITRAEVSKLYRDIRLTRASIRVPVIEFSDKSKIQHLRCERKVKEYKQIDQLSGLLQSLQGKVHHSKTVNQ